MFVSFTSTIADGDPRQEKSQTSSPGTEGLDGVTGFDKALYEQLLPVAEQWKAMHAFKMKFRGPTDDAQLKEAYTALTQQLSEALPQLLQDANARDLEYVKQSYLRTMQESKSGIPMISIGRAAGNIAEIVSRPVPAETLVHAITQMSVGGPQGILRAGCAADLVLSKQLAASAQDTQEVAAPVTTQSTSVEEFRRLFLERLGDGGEPLHTPDIIAGRKKVMERLIDAVAADAGLSMGSVRSYEQYRSSIGNSSLMYSNTQCSDRSAIEVQEKPGGTRSPVLDFDVKVKRPGQREAVIHLSNLEAENLLAGDVSVLVPFDRRIAPLSVSQLFDLYKESKEKHRAVYNSECNYKPEDTLPGGEWKSEVARLSSEYYRREEAAGEALGRRVMEVFGEVFSVNPNIARVAVLERLDHAQRNVRGRGLGSYLGTMHIFGLFRLSARFGDQDTVKKVLSTVCNIADFHRKYAATSMLEALETRNEMLQ